MDKIYECAAKFVALENYEYRFVVSERRKSRILRLNFYDGDFFHLAGFQYLSDISIPYGGDKLYWMLKEKICNKGSVVLYQHPNYIQSC